MDDPLARIIELDLEISSLLSALDENPGSYERYELSQTLEYREKRRERLLAQLTDAELSRLELIREQPS